MKEEFTLEKALWTEADFEQMNWHDCPVHALSFNKDNQLLLDIDYIFKWVLMKNKKNFKFWISPCTLVFENVYNIVLESDNTQVIIDNISKENSQRPKNAEYINKDLEHDWIIETTGGEISFTSVGFKQYVRQAPVLTAMQELDLAIRNGISFDQFADRAPFLTGQIIAVDDGKLA